VVYSEDQSLQQEFCLETGGTENLLGPLQEKVSLKKVLDLFKVFDNVEYYNPSGIKGILL